MKRYSRRSTQRERLRFPDFLGVGVQKCGTSWVDRNLRSHPDLWLPAIKELHYFNSTFLREKSSHWAPRLRKSFVTDALNWQFKNVAPEKWNLNRLGELAHIGSDNVNDEWYGKIFASSEAHQVCGEITPDYQCLPDRAIQHIVSLSPAIRLLVVLRDPIERSWSEIRMVASEQARRTEDDLNAIARRFDVYERTDYVGLLDRWSRRVPRDRMHVIFLDDIVQEPKSVIAKVCKFLDVRPDPGLFENLRSAANVGAEMKIPESVYSFLRNQLRDRYVQLGALYPERVATWLETHRL